MKITSVRIALHTHTSLRAFVTVVLNECLVVHDIKIVVGTSGTLFVSMPSRQQRIHCMQCHAKNDTLNNYCGKCGAELTKSDENATCQRAYFDIIHPIDAGCREYMNRVILNAYHKEVEASQKAGYVWHPLPQSMLCNMTIFQPLVQEENPIV